MSDQINNLQAAEAFLLSYSPEKPSGATYTLGRMRQLMERLGNPQNKTRAIHVAGTSGKTSTAYYIRALLEAQGKKTGLTASPHIVSIAERVQVGGLPLPEAVFLRYLNEFISLIEPWSDIAPSYFELTVALAFWVFEREKVDYMIVEVGLGGLLDATNVIARHDKISVITPVGLDHTTVLGDTIEAIAVQKAGIILPNSVVFSAPQQQEAYDVIVETAGKAGSRLVAVEVSSDTTADMPLFQQANFSLARTVYEYVSERDDLPLLNAEVLARCMTATPPGRFEVYRINEKILILDGAHNPQKLSAFEASLRQKYSQPATWLLGLTEAPADKIDACLHVVTRKSDDYIFTEFHIGQDIKGRSSVSAEALQGAMRQGIEAITEVDAHKALGDILASKKDLLVVSGSLYLVALLRPYIRELAGSEE